MLSKGTSANAFALLPGHAALRADGRLLEQAAGEGWEGALAALDALLAQARPRGGVRVVLSHHFARALLLPPPPVRLSRAEMDGWVTGRLAESYGAEAVAWRPVWQDMPPGRPVPVAVMDGARFDRLDRQLKESGLVIGSVEPWFSAAWNRHRRVLAGRSGWLALLEPGRIALARVESGQPASLRTAQAGADPLADLAAMIARESLHGGVEGRGDLWLAAVGVDGVGVDKPAAGTLAGCVLHGLLPNGAAWSGLLP
jgi:hypothetical protein